MTQKYDWDTIRVRYARGGEDADILERMKVGKDSLTDLLGCYG